MYKYVLEVLYVCMQFVYPKFTCVCSKLNCVVEFMLYLTAQIFHSVACMYMYAVT